LAQCLHLLQKASDRADHDLLVTMAQRWLELAERARRFERFDPASRKRVDIEIANIAQGSLAPDRG
jgi:hypothetical protein